MPLQAYPFASVLTGDLIGSRRRDENALNRAMARLAQAAEDITTDTGHQTRFERHRGDGWQMLLPDGRDGLRAALRTIAALAADDGGLATRLAIGLGDAELPPSQTQPSQTQPPRAPLAAGRGAAFLTAGDALDAMPRNTHITLTPEAGPLFAAMTGLIDWQCRNWTPPQADALFFALRRNKPTQEDMANHFGISRQAVQARLAGTGLPALRQAIDVFETTIAQHMPLPKGDTP